MSNSNLYKSIDSERLKEVSVAAVSKLSVLSFLMPTDTYCELLEQTCFEIAADFGYLEPAKVAKMAVSLTEKCA